MDIKIASLVVVSILDFVFGSFLFFKGKNHLSSRAFGVFSFFIALWTFSVFMFLSVDNDLYSLGWMRFAYTAAGFAGVAFWLFGITLRHDRLTLYQKLFSSIPMTTYAIFLIKPGFLLLEISHQQWGKLVIQNPAHYAVFSVLFVFYFTGGLWMVWKKYSSSSGLIKIQIGYIFYSVLVAGIFGMLFNLLLSSPVFQDWRFMWLGPLFTFLIVLFVTVSITKYQLMSHAPTLRGYVVYWGSLFIAVIAGVLAYNSISSLLALTDHTLIIIITVAISTVLYSPIKNQLQKLADKYFISSLGL